MIISSREVHNEDKETHANCDGCRPKSHMQKYEFLQKDFGIPALLSSTSCDWPAIHAERNEPSSHPIKFLDRSARLKTFRRPARIGVAHLQLKGVRG
jgi:hypothetical protein